MGIISLLISLERFGLIGVLGFQPSVQSGAHDGDTRADRGLRRDFVSERQDGEPNDENTLTHVPDRVRHRLNLTQGLVRDLVVQVVERADLEEG